MTDPEIKRQIQLLWAVLISSIVAGALLIYLGGWDQSMPVWLWLKILLVLAMLAFHGLLERHAVSLREGRETKNGRYFRIINEVPTVLLIGIVILVIIKPF